MKILYIVNIPMLSVQTHIIEYLRSKDIDVVIEQTTDSGDYNWKRFAQKTFQDKHLEEKYDFIISNTHSTYPQFRSFQNKVKPRVGFIDLEHDLLSCKPEFSIDYGKSAILIFHNKYFDYAKEHLSSRKLIKCRWPLLDVPFEPKDFKEASLYEDAIVVDTYAFNCILGKNMKLPKGFRKFWYKKFLPERGHPINVTPLPDYCCCPKGVKHCFDICKFVITRQSSIFVESLLFGAIPILLTYCLVENKKHNDIFSYVRLKNNPLPKFKAIIADDLLPKKLERLRANKKFFEEVQKELFLDWFDEDYFLLTSAHEAMYKFILEAKSNAI
jgi:hypothetical protein